MDYSFLFVLIAIAVIIAVVAVANWYQRGLRQQMWQELADRYGFQYFAGDPHDLANRYGFALFGYGRSQCASNCVEGSYGQLPVILFDYRYTTGSGKNSHTHSLSALLCELRIHCPSLLIRPETLLDRFAEFFGFENIRLESDEFNRVFNVKGEDKKFAYDICHPEMMEFLLRNRSWTWEFRGRHLLVYEPDKEFKSADVDSALVTAAELVNRIPKYLQDEAQP
jgi:hypothetical protein